MGIVGLGVIVLTVLLGPQIFPATSTTRGAQPTPSIRAGSVDWVVVGNLRVDDCARWQLPAPAALYSLAPVKTVAIARLAAFRRAGSSCTATFRIATNATEPVAIQIGTFVIEYEIRAPNGASYAWRSGLAPASAPRGTAWALTILSSPDECAGATNCVP